MFKNQLITKKQLVEIVENLEQLLSDISTTLSFWKLDTMFPCNLIKDCCDEYYNKFDKILTHYDSKSVSRSHINDK